LKEVLVSVGKEKEPKQRAIERCRVGEGGDSGNVEVVTRKKGSRSNVTDRRVELDSK